MLDLIIVGLCLAINAFFSAYEMAFVTVTKEEIEEIEDNRKGIFERLKLFKKKPERTLSVIQIGITLVGAIAAAVGGTGAVESLEPYFTQNFDLSKSMAEAISVTIVIVPLTYFSVVFGELLPKTIALKHPVEILRFGTAVLSFIDKVLSPIVTFLEVSTNFLLKLLRLHEREDEDESMGQSVDIGNLPVYHQKFVQNLVGLKGKKVHKAMIPWDKVSALNFSDSEEDIRLKMRTTPHSRYPVVDGDLAVGILLRKDFLEIKDHVQAPWQGILRPAARVSESQKILEAFLKMQEKQIPLAIVENSEEKYVGIITIEDILEEVVGDINDKTDYSITSRVLSNRPRININKQ